VIVATFAYALFWWWIGPNPPPTRRAFTSDHGMGGVIPAVSTDSGSSSHDSGDGHGGGDCGGHAF
jgi:hypothetical protein